MKNYNGKRRPSGDGMVRKREDGRWEGRVVVGYDEAGNPKTKMCWQDEEGMRGEAGTAEGAVRQPPPHSGTADNALLGAWLDYWYQKFFQATAPATTQLGYEGWIYNHLISGLGSIQLNQADPG